MATATVMETKVRYDVKDDAAEKYPQAEVWDAINVAVRHVVRRIAARWPQYYMRRSDTQRSFDAIVSGTANYDLPADFFVPVLITLTDTDDDTTELDPLTFERTLDSDADGYFLRNDDLYVFPEPTANVANGLTIYYVARPTEVAADATVVPFSDDFEDVIRKRAVLDLRSRDDDRIDLVGPIDSMLQAHMDAVTSAVNFPEDLGLHSLWRDWI